MSDQFVAEAATYTAHNKLKRRTPTDIRTRDPSHPAAAGLCLRRQAHRDWFRDIMIPYYHSSVAEFLANRITMSI
jgi:hypothetical protein